MKLQPAAVSIFDRACKSTSRHAELKSKFDYSQRQTSSQRATLRKEIGEQVAGLPRNRAPYFRDGDLEGVMWQSQPACALLGVMETRSTSR